MSGYSFGKLGATFPSAGGVVECLGQAYGIGIFSGAMSVMLYIAAVVSIALVAKAFGSYAFSMMTTGSAMIWKTVFSVGIFLTFVAVNLQGPANMAKLENIIVLLKVLVLAAFAVAGLSFIDPTRLDTASYPPASHLFYSLAITFFAYEGFRIITNATEDMPDPQRTLPCAIMTSILIVMALYIALALVVFGQLAPEDVVASKDFALARAAGKVMELGIEAPVLE